MLNLKNCPCIYYFTTDYVCSNLTLRIVAKSLLVPACVRLWNICYLFRCHTIGMSLRYHDINTLSQPTTFAHCDTATLSHYKTVTVTPCNTVTLDRMQKRVTTLTTEILTHFLATIRPMRTGLVTWWPTYMFISSSSCQDWCFLGLVYKTGPKSFNDHKLNGWGRIALRLYVFVICAGSYALLVASMGAYYGLFLLTYHW